MQYATLLCFFFFCKVTYSLSLQQIAEKDEPERNLQEASEDSDAFTSINAIIAYCLIVAPLCILCICAAWKRLFHHDSQSSGTDKPPAGSECPRTPTLLESKRAASFNEKEKDLESGKLEAKEEVKMIGVLSESKEIDLDELIQAGTEKASRAHAFSESDQIDVDEFIQQESGIYFTDVIPAFHAAPAEMLWQPTEASTEGPID